MSTSLRKDLNLKTTINISDKDFNFELFTIKEGITKAIKFDDKVFVLKQDIKQDIKQDVKQDTKQNTKQHIEPNVKIERHQGKK